MKEIKFNVKHWLINNMYSSKGGFKLQTQKYRYNISKLNFSLGVSNPEIFLVFRLARLVPRLISFW